MCIYLKEKRAAYRQTTHQILNVQCSESWWRGESDVNGNRARDYWIMSHWNESLEHTATFLLALLPYPLCISHTHSISAGSFFLYVHSTFSHPVSCTHREREKTIPDVCWPYVYTWIFATFFSRCVSKMLFLGASFPRRPIMISHMRLSSCARLFLLPLFICSSCLVGSACVLQQSTTTVGASPDCLSIRVYKTGKELFFLMHKIKRLDCIMYLTVPLKNFAFFSFFCCNCHCCWLFLCSWKFPLSRVLWHSLDSLDT